MPYPTKTQVRSLLTLLCALFIFSPSTNCLAVSSVKIQSIDGDYNCTSLLNMPYPTKTQVRSLLSLLSQPPSGNDEFFAHVRDDVIWTVTGKSFLSGVWTTKTSYRAATWAKIGNLVKPPGIKLEIAQGEEGIIIGQHGWTTADLYTVDTYTNSGVRYDQSYAWHMRFDESGMVAEVKVWLDTLTLETVLGGEATKLNGITAMGKSV